MQLTVWTCTTEGDDMPLETTVHATFEEAAEPCREALRQMEWLDPLDTAAQIGDAWAEVFDGACIIREARVEAP